MIKPVDPVKFARALDALCSVLGHGTLWNEEGPTQKAVDLRSARRLDKRSRLLVHVAWALWNESSDVSLVEVLDLEEPDRAAVVALLQIMMTTNGQALALDAWICGRRWRAERERAEGVRL